MRLREVLHFVTEMAAGDGRQPHQPSTSEHINDFKKLFFYLSRTAFEPQQCNNHWYSYMKWLFAKYNAGATLP
jgi:hypothetical protein